ncbi:MAG: hypothetical protein WC523_03755 [Patescibacteria group bacterium]
MSEANVKQSVSGFQIVSFQVKKGKEKETVKLLLTCDVDSIGCGEYDVGDILKAFVAHQTGETDIGLSVFVEKKE